MTRQARRFPLNNQTEATFKTRYMYPQYFLEALEMPLSIFLRPSHDAFIPIILHLLVHSTT